LDQFAYLITFEKVGTPLPSNSSSLLHLCLPQCWLLALLGVLFGVILDACLKILIYFGVQGIIAYLRQFKKFKTYI